MRTVITCASCGKEEPLHANDLCDRCYWKERNKQAGPAYYKENKERIAKKTRSWQVRIRFKVLTHYGGDPPKCACCGETTYEFLTVDHITGGGNKHRREVRGGKSKSGSDYYNWLIKNNYPSGIQILCMNCNFAKGKYGGCPHKKKERDAEPPKELTGYG